ncbi:carbonic anhydrase [Stachybotrys elegans]|uniref:Carbonic anhydrase n=1 Tax=Stachybotrys elegans TaxID=80388 RepID=A0A8K0SG60_9HYPO|nr:carbonic anhydrase [Stachybotrys elegans]
MPHIPSIEDLLERNAHYAQTHKPLLSMGEISQLPPEQEIPMPQIFIVSCCDPRIDAWEIFGLQKWDAVVTRSAAGRVLPQMQNLIFLDHLLHFTDVVILHHTDCTAEHLGKEDVQMRLNTLAPGHKEEIEKLNLPSFDNLEKSVRVDLQVVRSSPLIRPDLCRRTRGFIFDIKTGKVTEVKAE